MGYTVKLRGLEVRCDSVDELVALLDRHGGDGARPDGGPRGTLADAARVCGASVGADESGVSIPCCLSAGHAGDHR